MDLYHSSIDQIKKPVNPLALRTSGHLLVGLSRIFARKVHYLYTDTTETYQRLNLTIKPGGNNTTPTDLIDNDIGLTGNINMAPIGSMDYDLPDLGNVDVLA